MNMLNIVRRRTGAGRTRGRSRASLASEGWCTLYRRAGGGLLILGALAAGGCTGSGSGTGGREFGNLAPSPVAPATASSSGTGGGGRSGIDRSRTGGEARVVATVGDTGVVWGDLLPELAEASGGLVLEEHALGIVVEQECARRGVRVTEQMVRDERTLLSRSLARSANVAESEGESLIAEIRRSRRLGDARFAGLLRRNAGLRALVRAEQPETITPEDLATAYELKHGPRVVARMILVRTQQLASDALARIASGQSFAEVAAQMSIDPSSDRGGLLDPFSLADANYPVGVRRALGELTPGRNSDPISVTFGQEQGFAIVRLERTEPSVFGTPSKESVAAQLEQEVRLVRERARMDRLAQSLLAGAGVSVIDRSLGWAWDQRFRTSP